MEEPRRTDPIGQAPAHFLSTSLLRNVFIENLHRRVHALEAGRGFFPRADTLRAARILRGYFSLRNPGFLAYRFGDAEARAVMDGLAWLQRELEGRACGAAADDRSGPLRVSVELL